MLQHHPFIRDLFPLRRPSKNMKEPSQGLQIGFLNLLRVKLITVVKLKRLKQIIAVNLRKKL